MDFRVNYDLDNKTNKRFCFDNTVVPTLLCKTFLIRLISLMEMETLQNWSDSEAVVATCSLRINKPVADYHLLAISASEYLLNFFP